MTFYSDLYDEVGRLHGAIIGLRRDMLSPHDIRVMVREELARLGYDENPKSPQEQARNGTISGECCQHRASDESCADVAIAPAPGVQTRGERDGTGATGGDDPAVDRGDVLGEPATDYPEAPAQAPARPAFLHQCGSDYCPACECSKCSGNRHARLHSPDSTEASPADDVDLTAATAEGLDRASDPNEAKAATPEREGYRAPGLTPSGGWVEELKQFIRTGCCGCAQCSHIRAGGGTK